MPAVFTPHDIRLAIAAPTIFYPSSTKERMNFSEIALSPEIQKAIEAEGYTQPTPIQAKAIPRSIKRSRSDWMCTDRNRKNSSICTPNFRIAFIRSTCS